MIASLSFFFFGLSLSLAFPPSLLSFSSQTSWPSHQPFTHLTPLHSNLIPNHVLQHSDMCRQTKAIARSRMILSEKQWGGGGGEMSFLCPSDIDPMKTGTLNSYFKIKKRINRCSNCNSPLSRLIWPSFFPPLNRYNRVPIFLCGMHIAVNLKTTQGHS